MKRGMLLVFLFISVVSRAQQVADAVSDQAIVEEEHIREDEDELSQQLDFYREHRMNINTATADDLRQLGILNEMQVVALITYRRFLGNLIDVYELQAVPGWHAHTIRRLLPLIYAGNDKPLAVTVRERFAKSSHELVSRWRRVIERSRGYSDTAERRFQGDPDAFFIRFTGRYASELYYGMTAEKDAGERFDFNAKRKGFDFYSLHLLLRNAGNLKVLAAGDYRVSLGQGLVHWQAAAFGKGADITAIKRQSPKISPYRSAGEFHFSRGLAGTWSFGKVDVTGFFSHRKLSARASDSTGTFSGFDATGLHRSIPERASKNRVSHTIMGGAVSWSRESLDVSANVVSHAFSHMLQRGAEPYQLFLPSGRSQIFASGDYSFTSSNFHFFGEMAVDGQLNKAMVHGFLSSLHQHVDVSGLFRYLSKGYRAPLGNAFSESSEPGNEQGFFLGLRTRPHPQWELSAYCDMYRFPWLKYGMDAPAGGVDYFGQLIFRPDKKIAMAGRLRHQEKPGNGIESAGTIPYIRTSLRIHVTAQFRDDVTINCRSESAWFNRSGSEQEEGFLAYIEVAKRTRYFRSQIRLQYFETGGWNSRIYVHESYPAAMAFPAFSGEGYRYYANVVVRTGRVSITGFLSGTIYKGRETIGSGADVISGNRRTEFSLQTLVSF